MKQLTTLKWLLKREIWENKVMLIWSNLVLGGLILLFTVPFFFRMSVATLNLDYFHDFQKERLLEMSSPYFSGGVTLFSILMVAVMYSYATSCMSDERKDRSIFFWKSLPMSDELTVASKLLVALILFPLMALATLTVTTLIALFALWGAYVIHGVNLFSLIFVDSGIFEKLWNTFTCYPIYIAWAFPTVAWLILVSAWVKNRAGMWAILIPIGFFACTAFVSDVAGLDLGKDITYVLLFRGIISIVPNSWSLHHEFTGDAGMSIADSTQKVVLKADLSSWDIFATSDMWIGVVAGVAMLFMAARIRRGRGD